MKKILIITHRNDAHAEAVSEALKRKGAKPLLWYPKEYLEAHKTKPYGFK